MTHINVREFGKSMALLFEEQKETEKSIDFEAITRRAGDVANPDRVEALSASSEFFIDSTLFSLLRHHKDTQMDWERRSRARRVGGADQPVTRKPQAKDVKPNRVLEEEDEILIRKLEEEDILGPDKYINPSVPKKRRYVAESKMPAILRTLAPPSDEASWRTDVESSVSSPIAESSSASIGRATLLDHASETKEFSVEARDIPVSETSELATDASHARDSDIAKIPAEDDNEEDDMSMTATNEPMPEEPEVMDHPDIPETKLSRTFMDMAHKLEHSPLYTVKQSSMLDLLPRQRAKLNYARLNRHDRISKTQTSDTEESAEEDEVNYSDEDDDDGEEQNGLAGETVLSIAIYHTKNPDVRMQEFQVLGSQPLTDLRDIIHCLKDFTMNRDRQGQAEDGPILNTPRKKLSSSFFFMEDVFYVDKRAEKEGLDPGEDVSERIRTWVKEDGRYQQPQLAEYTKRDMEDVRWNDLTVRLNHPYLFSHQNGCEHLMMIRDIWIHSTQETQNRNEYPLIVYNWRYTRFKCTMCTVYPAEYVTTNDLMSGFSPCYFCKRCFKPFHYDKDGKQMFSFTVSDYCGM